MVNYYDSSIIDAKHGDVQVSKLVYGDEVVWEHEQPAWKGYNSQGVLIDYVACKSAITSSDISSACVSGVVGECVVELSAYTFDSKSITAVTLNEGLTTIGHECFQDCSSLTSVTFPSTVTSIGFWVFSRNTNLQWVEFKGLPPTWVGSTGSGTDKLFHDMSPMPIYVPCDYYDTWIASPAWSAFADYIVARCDYSKDYFTTVAKSNGTIKFNGSTTANTLSYSTDNGTTWSTAIQKPSVTVNSGDKVLWKGTCTPGTNAGIGNFSNGTSTYDVEGNAMSLLFGDNFSGRTSLAGKNYTFYGLFSGNTKVISAANLSLPAISLAERCYQGMFENCTSLTKAPELPAKSVTWCSYAGMFKGCTSLKTAPVLPALVLYRNCYDSMFYNCTSLKSAPALPAKVMTISCYREMFYGCTGITTAPVLPATTLNEWCYYQMFFGCTNLNSITCLATDISAGNCTLNWVDGVAATGTFTKAAGMTGWTTGISGIPNGWREVDPGA